MEDKLVEHTGFKKIRHSWKSLIVLMAGLSITFILSFVTYRYLERLSMEELVRIGQETEIKIDSRLHAHALLLRAGTAHMAVSDTVTREDWKEFVERTRLDINLPGTQGLGYTVLVRPEELRDHIEMVRREGFPGYTITPEGERELYTSIIFLEPFTGRNLRAFGFDMYSEPVRRRAMELSRDYNMAVLSGKVDLVQETGEDLQAGTLMYVPLYERDLPTNTVEERRAALKGWVYSPYRMRDLMRGIMGSFDMEHQDRVRLQIYDDSISVSSLLYDSQRTSSPEINKRTSRTISRPIDFNGTRWLLVFSQSRQTVLFSPNVLIVFFSGIIISILLYLLSLSYFKIQRRSKRIRKQNEELHNLNVTKDKFFSIIAHDLKSPFNSIIGFSKILIDQVEKKKYEGVSRYAEIIHQSSNVAMDLLTNLMEWSQSQTGRFVFNPEKFDLKDIVHEVHLLFSDLAKHKSVEIITEVPEPFEVYADYEMVGTILRNLLSNSLKFTHPGGKIMVSAKKEKHSNVIWVSDTGVGIPPAKINKLFRIEESYSTKGTQNEKGTGLGLILCREFVEKHGGTIWVESNVENEESSVSSGSTFYFSLPFELPDKKKEAVKKTS